MADADTQKLGEDMAALFNTTECDLGSCCIIALHFAVSASAGYFPSRADARAAMVSTIDKFMAELPAGFSDLDRFVN